VYIYALTFIWVIDRENKLVERLFERLGECTTSTRVAGTKPPRKRERYYYALI